jgi:hypothetical protein
LALWLLVALFAATLFSMASIGRKLRTVNSELANSRASFAPVEAGPEATSRPGSVWAGQV